MSEKQRLYMYPKSSCNCYQCNVDSYKFPKGVPTNLATRDCKIPSYYDCYNRRNISTSVQPQRSEQIKINYINPKAYSDKYSDYFSKIDCKCNGKGCNHCPREQFASWDPRTFSTTRNHYLTFDRPPLEGTPKLKNIYDKKFQGYGQRYKTYSDITAGQIAYYTDESRDDPYYKPLFVDKVDVIKKNFKDPMGAFKPEYQRVVPYKNPITDDSCDYDGYCLSFVRDTGNHRQDILSGLMAKGNQQRWSPRWNS